MRTSSLMASAVLASHGISTDERLQRLEALDLSQVRRKLMEPEPEGKGWTEAQALEAEKWYKRYVAAIIKYPTGARHVPNHPIDLFWHQHILDTRAYAKDCQNVLGYFLHHYPYFGLNGDADQRDSSFDDTNAIYREMFGEDCRSMATFNTKKGVACGGDSPDGCGAGTGDHSMGVNCHGDGCACGCANCGRDSYAPAAPVLATVGASCNDGGSGTGCGQGCSRGQHHVDFGRPEPA